MMLLQREAQRVIAHAVGDQVQVLPADTGSGPMIAEIVEQLQEGAGDGWA